MMRKVIVGLAVSLDSYIESRKRKPSGIKYLNSNFLISMISDKKPDLYLWNVS